MNVSGNPAGVTAMTDDQASRICYRFGPFVLDARRLLLRRDDDVIQLPQKAFDVLAVLVERHGELVTKDDLLARVWPQTIVEENNLPRQISTLRKALGDTREHHEFIATIPGQGYRFVAPVERVLSPQAPASSAPPASRHAEHSAVQDAETPEVIPPLDAGHVREAPGRTTRLVAIAATVALVALPVLWGAGEQEAAPENRSNAGHLQRLTYGAGLQHQPAWSPDGQRVAFASDAAGNSDIWIQDVAQPLPVALTSSPETEWQPAWSPDGRWIAFRSERDGGGLYVMPATGGEPRRVTTFGFKPRWSPSGTRLLFSSSILDASKSSAWTVDVRGGEPRPLRHDVLSGYTAAYAAWRPREDRVSVWGRERGGGWRFATMSIDEGEAPVASAISEELQAAIGDAGLRLGDFTWAPAGTHLYFEGRTGDVSNLWRVKVEPRTLEWLERPERLTLGPGLDRDFAISPDGRRAVFSSLSERTRLWAVGVESTGRLSGFEEAVTSGSVGEYDAAAPRDGLRLAFRTSRGGQQQLWERSVSDGAERILLAGPAAMATSPRWSPDGRTLAYARRQTGGSTDAIGLFDAATGQERLVGVSPGWSIVPDDWSSDGATILAACRQRGANHRGYATCLVTIGAGAEHATVRQIASDPARSLICQRFSPDERWISFMATDSRRPGTSTLYIMPAQGGAWIPVTSGRSYDDKPRWSADGRILYYISDRGGPIDVWGQRIDPATGTPAGDPFKVTGFDDPARMVNTNLGRVEIAVSEDRIFLPLTETTGDVWVLDLP